MESRRWVALSRRYLPVVILAGIMVAAFLVRWHYLSKHTEYTADSYYFLILSRSVKNTFTYTVRGVAHGKYLPGYPLAIWLGGYLLGGLERSANVIAVLGATLTVPVTYLLGKELFNRWAGLVAALIVAFQPTFLKWTCLPMTEGLFTLLFSLGVYMMLTGCKRSSPARRALAAALGGMAFVTRWEGVLFLPVALVIIVVYIKKARLRWWEPLVLLLLYGGPIGVYLIRNKIATGRLTAYTLEYEEHKEITYELLKHRFKVYGWEGMSTSLFYVYFYPAALFCLVRKKWRPFLIGGTWFAAFVLFHMFWYYDYERFMAPATPAVALFIGFMLVELVMLAWKGFGPGGKYREQLGDFASAAATVTACVVVSGLLILLVGHGLVRADSVIKTNYQAFADDHGGEGMVQAADWLDENAPGETVAVDAGPYFCWEYGGDVLYVRPVPWDLPVEDRDVEAPELVLKLHQRGVRYLVVGQTEDGVDAELVTLGMRPEDLAHLREVARWENTYGFPEPHVLTTAIFEVLPYP